MPRSRSPFSALSGTSEDTPTASTRTPTRGRSLRSNITWSFSGHAVNSVCSWLLFVILARSGSPREVGTLALAMGITAPVFTLLSLQLRVLQATAPSGAVEFPEVWNVRLFTSITSVVLATGLSLCFRSDQDLAWVVVSIALSKAFEALSDSIHGYLQRHERLDLTARSVGLRGLLTLSFFAGAYVITQSLKTAGFAIAFASALTFLASDLSSLRNQKALSGDPGRLLPQFRLRRHSFILMRSSLPLGIKATLITLIQNTPRYAIEAHLGREALGIFSALLHLVLAGSLVVASVLQAATPRLARYYHRESYQQLWALNRKLEFAIALICGFGTLFSAIAGSKFAAHVLGPEYGLHVDLLTALAAAGSLGFISSVAGATLTAAQQLRIQVPLFIFLALVGVLLSATLTPIFGALGAALGLFITNACRLLLTNLVLSRTVPRFPR